VTGVAIAGTDNDQVYMSERYTNLKYDIPVPVGTYSITLHFAEIYHQNTGSRVFDVLIYDCVPPLVQSAYDIVKAAGGPFIKTTITKVCSVNDGSLSIELNNAVVDYPKISGVEVLASVGVPAPTGVPVTAPVKGPTKAPVKTSTSAPVIVVQPTAPFPDLRINAGGGQVSCSFHIHNLY
jgi:Malectin domain